MQSVALIDYGSGNLRSAEKALQKAAAGLSRSATVMRLLLVTSTRARSSASVSPDS